MKKRQMPLVGIHPQYITLRAAARCALMFSLSASGALWGSLVSFRRLNHQHGILPAGSETGAKFVAAQSAGHRRERPPQVGGRGRRRCRVLAPVDGPQHQEATTATGGQQQLLFRHAALPAPAGVLL